MTTLVLDDESQVAVAGDWHSNVMWMQQSVRELRLTAPDVRTVLHLGDFNIAQGSAGKGFLNAVDVACRAAGIERILVTPGNHDDWRRLAERFERRPGEAIRMSDSVSALPPGFRFELGGRTFLSFGGAASLDFAYRKRRGEWSSLESPRDADVANSVSAGPTDVLLTHEAVNGGCPRVEEILRSNPMRWDDAALAYSAASRRRITKLWEGVRPALLAHGHMHAADQRTLPDGRKIYSLGSHGQRKNVGLLTIADLAWVWMN